MQREPSPREPALIAEIDALCRRLPAGLRAAATRLNEALDTERQLQSRQERGHIPIYARSVRQVAGSAIGIGAVNAANLPAYARVLPLAQRSWFEQQVQALLRRSGRLVGLTEPDAWDDVLMAWLLFQPDCLAGELGLPEWILDARNRQLDMDYTEALRCGGRALEILRARGMTDGADPDASQIVETLRTAFRKFADTLEATTLPAAGGARIVGGIPHAVALSEETDTLYRALRAAGLWLSQEHGHAVAKWPPDVALMESDSPDGPWTPVPADAVRAIAMPIGGDGADATLLAAIENATKVAAFPIDKWNAMQAARPGAAHQRFHAGETISAHDLAVLESAAKLLRLKAPPVVTVPPLASERADDAYRPATWFPKGMAPRLRVAAHKDRKTKRVAKRTVDGVVCYSVADARRWWPADVPKDA